MPTIRKRVARTGGPMFDEVVMSYLQGEKPPQRLSKAQSDAVHALVLLTAPDGCGVVNGRVVTLPEGCSRNNRHWKAWLDAEVADG